MADSQVTPKEAERKVSHRLFGAYLSLVKALEAKYGEEGRKVASDAFDRFVCDESIADWRNLKDLNAQAYVEWLMADPWQDFEYEFVENTPNSVRLKITKCLYARHCQARGLGRIGLIFCNIDYAMIKDFNDVTGGKLGFERTKTLMAGDVLCNHHFFVKDEAAAT